MRVCAHVHACVHVCVCPPALMQPPLSPFYFSLLLPHLPSCFLSSSPSSFPLPLLSYGTVKAAGLTLVSKYLHGQDGHWDSREVHRGQTGETHAN